jgi:hypothetical protein
MCISKITKEVVMITERKLRDTISALFMSYFIIVTIFQVTSRFFSVGVNVSIAVVGLILAVVFLFVNPTRRRTMRIVSIACNSISIGSVIGILYSALDIVLPMIVCIGISLLYIGVTFLIYYFIYILDSRIISSFICGAVLLVLTCIYFSSVYKVLDMVYNFYIIIFGIMTLIHYVIAICVVHSDKNSVITGMSYGYFFITIAVVIVVAIFLLLASEGDVDLDINGGGSSKSSGKGSKVSSRARNTSSKRVLSDAPSGRAKKLDAGRVSRTTNNNMVLDVIDASLYALDDIADALALQGMYMEDIDTLKKLDDMYKKGTITKEQYFILRDELFPEIV